MSTGYNINSSKWKKYRLRYLNKDGTKKFKMPDDTLNLLLSDPKKFKSFCNGVGSRVGWLGRLSYHFIPNFCWFVSIIIQADLHDVGYSVPKIFKTIEEAIEYKEMIDSDFRDNICIEAQNHCAFIREAMEAGALVRYKFVANLGLDSFLNDKIILNNK